MAAIIFYPAMTAPAGEGTCRRVCRGIIPGEE